MKRAIVVGVLLLALLAIATTALAQTGGGFGLSWSSVDGGGGTSVGGKFTLAGTIGQADAGNALAGGDFILLGGFQASARVESQSCPTLSTSFEFSEIGSPIGDFVLGNSPKSVSFLGGQAKSVGVLPLYHSGVRSWHISAGNTGTITFETPAQQVSLFFRDQSSSVQSLLTVFDTSGQVIDTFEGTQAIWTNVAITVADEALPIGSITLQHRGATGDTVIDDFSFCAAASGGVRLVDPIPESISPGPVPIRLEPVATGLTAPNWGIFAPGDSQRLFVTDQPGTLWAIDLATGDKTVFLDVSGRLVSLGIFGEDSFDERGLLGVAFHPGYTTNGLLYTYTSEPVSAVSDGDFSTMPQGETADHQSVILEWRVPDPANPASVVDPASARELLRIDQPQFNHDGGALNFGPDGMLYISLGDGGGADDVDGQSFIGGPIIGHGTTGNGQDPGNVLGAILRIDPLGSNSANGQYGIPADNPFFPGGAEPFGGQIGCQDGFCDEIYAYGFRNPFRFSFDMATGGLYIADVGQNDIEEIDLGVAGGNYGWNLKEGAFFFDPNGNDPGFVTDVDPGVPPGLIDPIGQYDHDEGIAIIGGFVYRGGNIPALQGRYVFGDFAQTFNNDGRLFHLMGDQVVEFPLGQDALGLSLLGFGQDASGELYVLANGTGVPFGTTGVVLRIDPARCGDQNNDGEVNVFDVIIDLQIAVGLIESSSAQRILGDLNLDGAIDVFDAIIGLQHVAGLRPAPDTCGPT